MLRKKLVFDSRLTGTGHSNSNYIVHDPSLLQHKNIVIREIAVTTPRETITNINNTCKITLQWIESNTNPTSYTADFVLSNGVYLVDNASDFRDNFNSAMINALTGFKAHLDQGLHYIEADNTNKMIINSNVVQMSTSSVAPEDIAAEFTNFNGIISPNPATTTGSVLQVSFSPVTTRFGEGGISNILNGTSDPFFRMLGTTSFDATLFNPIPGNDTIHMNSCLKAPDTLFLRSGDLIKNTGYSLVSNVNAATNQGLHNDVVAVLNLDKSKDVNRYVFNFGEYTFSIADRSNSFSTLITFLLTDIADNIISSNPSDFLQVVCDMI